MQIKRILGIDPGTNILGYAVVETSASEVRVVEIGVVTMTHLESQQEKLQIIFERIQRIIQVHRPQEMAIEAPFFGKNVQSMLKLGRAQGVAIAAAMTSQVPIEEYSPKKIKQSVTGNGNASKEQVAAMLQQILKVELKEKYFDATDALATAMCHHFQNGLPSNRVSGKGGWDQYLKDNPKRIIT